MEPPHGGKSLDQLTAIHWAEGDVFSDLIGKAANIKKATGMAKPHPKSQNPDPERLSPKKP
ncbi:hypothetical protein AB6Q56_00465 [Dechloromonas sp. ARDL1]|uniref:hypothetical protein n=1 Tax=Dechloromonas sp. ARDL1 TaxID=3322121 RepID=UPI003DA76850